MWTLEGSKEVKSRTLATVECVQTRSTVPLVPISVVSALIMIYPDPLISFTNIHAPMYDLSYLLACLVNRSITLSQQRDHCRG